jgi:hypothetical protein
MFVYIIGVDLILSTTMIQKFSAEITIAKLIFIVLIYCCIKTSSLKGKEKRTSMQV